MQPFHVKDHELNVEQIHRNLPPSALYEHAIRFEKDTSIAESGALVAYSGAKTGRSPKDKRILRHPASEKDVWWGPVNIPLEPTAFAINRERARDYLNTRERLYCFDGFAGWDPNYRIKIRVICSRPYHALFMHTMLIRPTHAEVESFGKPDFVIYNAGAFPSNRFTPGVGSKTSVDLSLEHRELIILGTEYAGEMKKGVFTVANYLAPKRDLLSMHCSATADKDTGRSSLLFGLVLAIGIVVDDAVVVLENIERHLEMGKPARQATIDAMAEITGPILAITLVLSSVLLPSAFLSGLVGQFFRQFAVTISVSMILSAINAMTMTPALAVLFFRNRKPGHHGDYGKEALPWWSFALFGGLASMWLLAPILGGWLGLPSGEVASAGLAASLRSLGANLLLFLPGVVVGGVLGWFVIRYLNWALGRLFRGFNWLFDWSTRVYGTTVGWGLRLSAVVLLLYVGMIGLTGFGFSRIPTGVIPLQNKGYLVTNVALPDSASLERTLAATDAVERIALETPGVAHTLALPGMSYVLNANSSNYSNVFIIFKQFDQRRDHALGGEAIAARIRERLAREVPEASVQVFGAPPISGLGKSAGFKLMLEGIGDVDFDALQAHADDLAAKGNQQPGLAGLFNSFRAHAPALRGHRPREGQVDGRATH